jgi:hypothetical protein
MKCQANDGRISCNNGSDRKSVLKPDAAAKEKGGRAKGSGLSDITSYSLFLVLLVGINCHSKVG